MKSEKLSTFIVGIITFALFVIATVTPTTAQNSETKVAQFVITSSGFDVGGHVFIEGLPEVMEVGKTYSLKLTFSFEWKDDPDANIKFDIETIKIGLVDNTNLMNIPELGGDVVLVNREKPPNWIYADLVSVYKEVKFGGKLTVEAYITPTKTTSTNEVYLMFEFYNSRIVFLPRQEKQPPTSALVTDQGIIPAEVVKIRLKTPISEDATITPTTATSVKTPVQTSGTTPPTGRNIVITPGFELVTMFLSFAVIALIYRIRRS